MTKTDKILAAWRPGKTLAEIARETGACVNMVFTTLHKHGLTTRKREKYPELFRRASPDKTIAELAREVGLCVPYVRKIVKKHGLPHKRLSFFDHSDFFDGARLDDLVKKYGRPRHDITRETWRLGFRIFDGVLVFKDDGDEEFEREHKGFAPWDREYGDWCDDMKVEGFYFAPATWKRYRAIWARKSRFLL